MQAMMETMGSYGPLLMNGIKALAVLIIGWMVAGVVRSVLRRKINASEHIDNTLGNFVASMVRWFILLMVLVAVLGLFGIEATSLVAVLGAATLAIGLALQGTLSDIAAGFMLILFRPYKLGQYVDIGGTAGTGEGSKSVHHRTCHPGQCADHSSQRPGMGQGDHKLFAPRYAAGRFRIWH